MADFFSMNLKYLREKKGLSQSKLGQIIGVNQTTIARWEDDNRVPTIDNAVDVAAALNVPLPELLGKDLRIEQSDEEKTFATTIYENNTCSMEIHTDKPFEALSDEEKEKPVQDAMDELYEYKRGLKNGKD